MPTLAQTLNNKLKEGLSPRRRRYGFFPGLYPAQVFVESSHSGQQETTMPQGVLVPFETTELREYDFEITKEDWKPTHMVERTAEWFIANVKRGYERFGFRELDMLTPLEDDEAEAYLNLVHGQLNTPCPQGLSFCATCRSAELQKAHYDDPTAESLRLRLLESYVTKHDSDKAKWAEILRDFQLGLAVLGEGEQHVRKNLHETAPEDRAALASDAYGKQTAEATREGMKEIAESFKSAQGNDKLADAVAQLAANQASAEARHAEEMAMMRQLIANGQNGVVVNETKVDKRTKEYKDAHKGESQSGD